MNVSIQINRDIPTPLYIQVAEAFKVEMQNGNIGSHTKLPSIRTLAKQLGVNTVTIVKAYKLLEQEGHAYTRIGSGTFVQPGMSTYQRDDGMDSAQQIYVPDMGIDFASATPAPEVFPVKDFKRLLNEVLDRDGGSAFGYQESQGYYPLRESLCTYLHESGVKVKVDHLSIISGGQQGIDIVAKALIDPGDAVIVESPTYQGAIASFSSRGAKLLPVTLRPDGIDMSELQKVLENHRPKFIYIMSHYQNPTGYSYSREKKEKLLALARMTNCVIVEDDYLSELSFGATENRSLRAMDDGNNVIYIKSFSKIFMPGLRIGLLIAPSDKNAAMIIAKQHSDISTSGLIQRTLDLYLQRRLWRKHLEFMRDIYLERYNITVQAMKNYFPSEVLYNLPQGGLHFWVKVPDSITSEKIYQECKKKDVLITPGTFFAPAGYEQYFRLSYAAVLPHQIDEGIAVIGEVIGKMLTKNARQRVRPLL